MKIKNISEGKIIGIGDVTVLPGEEKEVPEAFARSPILEIYKQCKVAEIIGDKSTEPTKTAEQIAAEEAEATRKATEEAEALRQLRLASLEGISDEALAKLSEELGINPAECKDQADVMKKVKAALKK